MRIRSHQSVCPIRIDDGVMTTPQRFNSIWDAIEDTPQRAAGIRARSELMMEIEGIIRQKKMTQAEAATLFGVTQPRISDLMRGKINLFSLDFLMDMATVAGLEPHLTIKKTKALRKHKGAVSRESAVT